jgi:DNA-binding XRE family transcriptional regulator
MSDEKSPKNPLALALGLVLKQVREKSNKTAGDIADSLDVSPSTYRLIEAGSSTLRPVYAPRLLQEEAFREIDFSSLAILLQATHSLDAIRKEGKQLRGALQEVGNLGSPLGQVISKLRYELDAEDKSDNVEVRTTILRTEVHRHVRRFLTTPTFSQELETQAQLTTKSFLTEVSPFYFDAAIRLLQDLKRSEPQLHSSKLGEWEAENADRMMEIRVVMRDLGVLFHEGNFEDFDFRYALNRALEDRDFKVRVIFGKISDEGTHSISPKQFKNRLIDELRDLYTWETNEEKGLAEGKLDITIENTFDFGHAESIDGEISRMLSLKDKSTKYNNLWMFKLSPVENVVSIIDSAEPKSIDSRIEKDSTVHGEEYGRLIDYEQSIRSFRYFNDLWNRISSDEKYDLENINT